MTYTLYFVSKLEAEEVEYQFLAIGENTAWRISVIWLKRDRKLLINVNRVDNFTLFDDSIILYERITLPEAITLTVGYAKDDLKNQQQ